MISQSVLLYHNGNHRVIKQFREDFRYHRFCGNWTDWCDNPEDHCLYEICIADATDENLSRARQLGIRILRYISAFEDDRSNQVDELETQSWDDWLARVVCKNLCFADVVVGVSLDVEQSVDRHGIIITTGRTANVHLQMIDKSIDLVENSKTLDREFFTARQAILLWRQNQWECLTSTWILQNTGLPTHQFDGKIDNEIIACDDLTEDWIHTDWKNLCQTVFDQALFFHYVLKRPIYHMITEDIISRFTSASEKVDYDKSRLISNFGQMQNFYDGSRAKQIITMCYNNTLNHII